MGNAMIISFLLGVGAGVCAAASVWCFWWARKLRTLLAAGEYRALNILDRKRDSSLDTEG
jgi:hypothetical protein